MRKTRALRHQHLGGSVAASPLRLFHARLGEAFNGSSARRLISYPVPRPATVPVLRGPLPFPGGGGTAAAPRESEAVAVDYIRATAAVRQHEVMAEAARGRPKLDARRLVLQAQALELEARLNAQRQSESKANTLLITTPRMDADYRYGQTSKEAATGAFAALPEPLRLHILGLTDSKSVARAAAVSRSFGADARSLLTTPSAVAQLLTATYGTPGTVLASMYMFVGRAHQLETEDQFLALASALQAMGAKLVRPLALNPIPRWYDGAGERGHDRVLALAPETVAECVAYQQLSADIRADLANAVLSDDKIRCTPHHRRVIDRCIGQPGGPTRCLLWATEYNDPEAVGAALAAGADVSARVAALQRAVHNGNTAIVVRLLRAGAAATDAQLDALVVGAVDRRNAADMVAALLRFGAESGLGSAHGMAGALSAAARHRNMAVLKQLLEGRADWSAPALLEAAVGAGEQASSWEAVDCLLPQLLVRTQQQPGELSPDADLLGAAAAGDAGGVQAAVAAGVSLRVTQLAGALAVRRGFVGAVEALVASPGSAGLLVPARPPLSGLVTLVCHAADTDTVQALLALLGGTWSYMQPDQRARAIHGVLESLHRGTGLGSTWPYAHVQHAEVIYDVLERHHRGMGRGHCHDVSRCMLCCPLLHSFVGWCAGRPGAIAICRQWAERCGDVELLATLQAAQEGATQM
ncbi:hypothetical protein TSOC_005233 [Tetrabaena socialis]|uniref:Ankyrin repeat domain-containing protein n=1 Tax=Tetrabaena socialis TaxID=47790 RepID=A0A2J8A6W0_9CHLO|nr:hypothetical protein TSOC_005233 [Tetrabaena socialis]|eukprot:PNH08258.1 hypothetical protein TSOC_005233 [Tetrabaena socialis]